MANIHVSVIQGKKVLTGARAPQVMMYHSRVMMGDYVLMERTYQAPYSSMIEGCSGVVRSKAEAKDTITAEFANKMKDLLK